MEPRSRKIKIGLLEYSTHLGVSKSVDRALKKSKVALEKLGYEVVPIKFSDKIWEKARDSWMGVVGNSEKTLFKTFRRTGEPLLKPVEQNALILEAGRWKRGLINFALKYFMNKGRSYTTLKSLKRMPPHKYDKHLKRRYEFVYELSEIWKAAGIEALIMPFQPHCAIKNKNVFELGLICEHSLIWNVTGFPAGILPITKVQEDEQFFKDSYNDAWTHHLNEDAQGSAGMPVCIQVVGYAYEDEKVLGVMKMLEKEIKYELDTDLNIDLSPAKKQYDPAWGYTLNRS